MEIKLPEKYPNELPNINAETNKLEKDFSIESIVEEIGNSLLGEPMLFNIISEIETKFKELELEKNSLSISQGKLKSFLFFFFFFVK